MKIKSELVVVESKEILEKVVADEQHKDKDIKSILSNSNGNDGSGTDRKDKDDNKEVSDKV